MYTGRNGVPRELWRNELMWLPGFRRRGKWIRRRWFAAGMARTIDTLNVMNRRRTSTASLVTTNTELTNGFRVRPGGPGDPLNGVSPLTDPFPVRSDGSGYDIPLRDALGPMARVGQGFGFQPISTAVIRVCSAGASGVQRELSNSMVVEASYWGQWGDRLNFDVRTITQADDLTHTRAVLGYRRTRNNAVATNMNQQVTNPFYMGTSNRSAPRIRCCTSSCRRCRSSIATTIAKNRLLRPFPHMNGLTKRRTLAEDAHSRDGAQLQRGSRAASI